MRGTRVSTGSKFEELASYSRAVVLPDAGGDWVMVSGTTGFDYAAMTISPDVADQAHQVFRTISLALEKAGSSLKDVVRIRVYLAAAEDFPKVAPIVGQYMRAAMPANTTVVAPLVDERMRIEVEVTARKAPGDQA
jgi:enamine deaminase RidA (YjgF/YER057c/UK114 family)